MLRSWSCRTGLWRVEPGFICLYIIIIIIIHWSILCSSTSTPVYFYFILFHAFLFFLRACWGREGYREKERIQWMEGGGVWMMSFQIPIYYYFIFSLMVSWQNRWSCWEEEGREEMICSSGWIPSQAGSLCIYNGFSSSSTSLPPSFLPLLPPPRHAAHLSAIGAHFTPQRPSAGYSRQAL